MELAIYFSIGFFDENSTVFKATKIEINEETMEKTISKVEDSFTTAAKLYQDGWRLKQVLHLDNFCSSQLIFERPTN